MTEDEQGRPTEPADRLPSAARWVYEGLMIALALVVLGLLLLENQGWVRTTNSTIWAVFVLDYAVRLALSGDRRRWIRENLADGIAVLPLELFRLARLARLARLVRLVRAGRVLWQRGPGS